MGLWGGSGKPGRAERRPEKRPGRSGPGSDRAARRKRSSSRRKGWAPGKRTGQGATATGKAEPGPGRVGLRRAGSKRVVAGGAAGRLAGGSGRTLEGLQLGKPGVNPAP